MAIDMKENGTVGCAFYVALDEALFLQEDIHLAGLELVETMLIHVQPTAVLVPRRAPDRLVECLGSSSRGLDDEGSADDTGSPYTFHPSSNTEFDSCAGKDKLLGLDLALFNRQSAQLTNVVENDIDSGDSYTQNKLLRLATLINLDSHISIGCAGAVLNDIQRRRSTEHLPDNPHSLPGFRVKTVHTFTLNDALFINSDALSSLHILRQEFHPNSQLHGPGNSVSGVKESLSVFGLLQPLASTPQGKSNLRKMFLRPSIDLGTIHERQRAITVFLRPENTQKIGSIVQMLRKIRNVKTPLHHLHRGVDHPNRERSVQRGVWLNLSLFAQYSVELREMVSSLGGGSQLSIVNRIFSDIDFMSIMAVGEFIHQTIDFEQSQERKCTAVRQGVDARLDELKHYYDGLNDFLHRVGQELIRIIPAWATRYIHTCTFFPQLGFLTAVALNPETGKGKFDGEGLVDDVWEMMFTNEGYIYYKNKMMRALDAQYGDIYCMISDREIEIIHALGVRVIEHEDAMIRASELYGELDSLVALALGADKYSWTAPRMTESNTIRIQGGRHPLQELVVPSFIPNDCNIAGGRGDELGCYTPTYSTTESEEELPAMVVLTGPNHSGKSVYLKQVALIVYLAHIGSFVPADSATIGLTDRILTRIATRESVSRRESAFAIDLRQAAFSINFATRRSLILIDEFGKGTNANNGASLLRALLEHFRKADKERPKVLAASHFHEIFQDGLFEEGDGMLFAHMTVHVDLDVQVPHEQVTYLFELAPGRCTSSFGTRCAAANGVDSIVVNRAESISDLLAKGEDLRAACAELTPEDERKLVLAEQTARCFLELNIPASRGRHDSDAHTPQAEHQPPRDLLRSIMPLRARAESSF
ncbi:hypothetical protein GQ53DRAFT_825406 [Thozetella sp. PMI_491]|nr:hypothetical protein GQ53DRAFT_825406 [Thozetella sp. PMI_491]